MPRRVAAVCIALVATSGCGERAGEPGAGADSIAGDPTVAASTARAAVPDSARILACDVITEAELEQILALELAPGRTTNDYAGDSACRWDLAGDPQRGVSISLRQLDDLEIYERVPGSSPVAGLGDAGVWSGDYGQLAVLRGGRVLSVNLLVEDPARARAERIARVALERIGAAPADSSGTPH